MPESERRAKKGLQGRQGEALAGQSGASGYASSSGDESKDEGAREMRRWLRRIQEKAEDDEGTESSTNSSQAILAQVKTGKDRGTTSGTLRTQSISGDDEEDEVKVAILSQIKKENERKNPSIPFLAQDTSAHEGSVLRNAEMQEKALALAKDFLEDKDRVTLGGTCKDSRQDLGGHFACNPEFATLERHSGRFGDDCERCEELGKRRREAENT